ncbi:transglutaminase family protein [Bremerella cremea]|uniref:transglutaminase-like domain-containing protein n=1 Tax=Bremerella cremea TaxID=1031537 RepID=UPI0031EF7338
MVKQFFAATLLLLACGSWASAQFGAVETPAASSGGVGNFETGFTLQVQGPALGVTATFPVPANWQDQKVELVRQELPPGASLKFLDLDGTSQARVDIPRMAAGDTAKVMLYFQVDRQPIVAPNRPESLTAPDQKQLDRTQRKYLLPGPFVESRDNKITTVAHSLAKPDASTWDQAEAYYDFVHQNVTYENGPMKGAVAALEEGRGDCEEMTTLFVALCRAGNIPARTVWVPGHCYPEFLTKTDDGTDRWVAVEMTGDFPFGQSPEKRPILQKGDNFRIAGSRKPQHYVKQELAIRDYKGSAPPSVTWLPAPGKEPPRAE